MKKVLIFGGNFDNKGAEAMSYVTIFEIKNKFLNFEPILLYRNANIDKNKDYYKFSISEDHEIIRMKVLGKIEELSKKNSLKTKIKNIIKRIIGKPVNDINNINDSEFKELLKETACIIDISGYALASSWPISATKKYFNMIEIAKKYNVPIYLLPQSFGPFGYKDEKILVDLKEHLKIPSMIFAREKEGYDYLTEKLGLSNVVLSTDLVLQNREINYDMLLKKKESATFVCKNKENNVAILPNMRVFDKCDNTYLLRLYKDIVDELLSLNKNVYLLRHSREDITPAKMIKEMYIDNDKVTLVEEQFPSYQFEEVVQKFDYVIASRYHSIVHAYKHNVPSIAIGWAVKYVELLGNFKQSQYIFDARNEISTCEIVDAIKQMNDNYLEEKKVIAEVLKEVQKNNCFDLVEKDIKSIINQ